jgi:hypothetical protein
MSKRSIISDHLGNAWSLSGSNKCIAQLTHYTLDRAVMDVEVGAVKVADGFLGAAVLRLKHKPGMPSRMKLSPAHR